MRMNLCAVIICDTLSLCTDFSLTRFMRYDSITLQWDHFRSIVLSRSEYSAIRQEEKSLWIQLVLQVEPGRVLQVPAEIEWLNQDCLTNTGMTSTGQSTRTTFPPSTSSAPSNNFHFAPSGRYISIERCSGLRTGQTRYFAPYIY